MDQLLSEVISLRRDWVTREISTIRREIAGRSRVIFEKYIESLVLRLTLKWWEYSNELTSSLRDDYDALWRIVSSFGPPTNNRDRDREQYQELVRDIVLQRFMMKILFCKKWLHFFFKINNDHTLYFSVILMVFMRVKSVTEETIKNG